MIAPKQVTQHPEVAPKGFYFYLATTPNPTDKGHRYLHSIHRPDKPFGEVRTTLSITRGLSKPFDRLTLARAYADFLNRMGGVAEFCIVLVAGIVLDRPSVPKVAQRGELKRNVKTHSEFTWE
jgi:hypothetical protein